MPEAQQTAENAADTTGDDTFSFDAFDAAKNLIPPTVPKQVQQDEQGKEPKEGDEVVEEALPAAKPAPTKIDTQEDLDRPQPKAQRSC